MPGDPCPVTRSASLPADHGLPTCKSARQAGQLVAERRQESSLRAQRPAGRAKDQPRLTLDPPSGRMGTARPARQLDRLDGVELLQHQQAVRSRAPSASQACERLSGVERETASKSLAAQRECPPVRACRRNEQEHVADGGVVALLQQDPPFGCLHVAEPRFSLECVYAPRPFRDGIPGPSVRTAVQRDLGPPRSGWWKAPSKPPQESDLCRISDRITVGIQAEARHQPDSDAQSA